MNKRHISFFQCVISALFLLLLWELAALCVKLPIIPSPVSVFLTLYTVFDSLIAKHLLYSLCRIFAGVLSAVVIGVPLGVFMGYFTKLERFGSPVVYLTYPIPKVALLPVVMLLFGTGELSKILILFSIIVFQIILSVRDSIRAIDEEMFYPLYSLGVSFKDIFTEILWPASLPKFLTALRISTATGISILFFTETFGTKYGLGYFVMDSWMRVNYLEMYAGIVVLSLMGLALFCFFDYVEHAVCSWNIK